MDWILDNIRLIVIVGGAIAYWLNQRRKAREEEQAARSRPAPSPVQATDDAERTRRIQEEIRRKIQERAGGGAKREPSESVVPAMEIPPLIVRSVPKENAYKPVEVSREASDQAVLEHQLELATKLRELDQKRREAMGRSEAFAEKTAVAMAASDTADRGSILEDLRSTASVRRAIVLREVLGTPVGLR